MNQNNEELKHYGVLGMKWGVHRATKRLNSAKTPEDRKKALAKLDKHRGKITKKLTSLNNESDKLEKQKFNVVTKTDVKSAKLQTQINRLNKKAAGVFTSENKAMKLTMKANKLNVKLNELTAYSNEVKAKVEKNKAMKETFNRTLNEVDSILLANGKKYMK